jgi:hypothetical protein
LKRFKSFFMLHLPKCLLSDLHQQNLWKWVPNFNLKASEIGYLSSTSLINPFLCTRYQKLTETLSPLADQSSFFEIESTLLRQRWRMHQQLQHKQVGNSGASTSSKASNFSIVSSFPLLVGYFSSCCLMKPSSAQGIRSVQKNTLSSCRSIKLFSQSFWGSTEECINNKNRRSSLEILVHQPQVKAGTFSMESSFLN